MSFDHMISPKLIRLVYILAIILISGMSLTLFGIGVLIFKYGWLLGVMAMLAAPVAWLFFIVIWRIFLEFVINQFKISEHLKTIRDRGGLR